MDVNELFRNGEIKVRSYNVCMDNDLSEVSEVIAYFKKHLSFKKLRNCGKLSDKELQRVVKRYCNEDLFVTIRSSQQLESGGVNESTSILHLHEELVELDVRAYNACKYNGIKTIGDLATYFHNHLTFEQFRNCGRKSGNQLIEVLENYVFSNARSETNETLQLYLNGNPKVKQRAYNYVTLLTSSLSDNGKKILNLFLGSSNDSTLITEAIIRKEFYKIHKNLPTNPNHSVRKEILDYFHEL